MVEEVGPVGLRTDVESQGTSWNRLAVRRLLRHPSARIGFAILAGLVVVGGLAPVLAPHDPIGVALTERMLPPSFLYPMGTDTLGRDILSRVLFGTRHSLMAGLLATMISVAIGGPVGVVGGFYANTSLGWVDSLVMRLVDIILAFPFLLLALLLVTVLGPSLRNGMIAVGLAGVPIYARLARGKVLSVKEEQYVVAAQATGATQLRIIVHHVLPNSVQSVMVQATLGVGTALLAAASLSFLGLGARPPTPEWGAMLNAGKGVLQEAPWISAFPGLAIVLSVLGVNLFGDALRDALDPTTQV